MPIIEFSGPKLTADQKRELVAEFTRTAQQVTNLPVEAFTVIIQEIPSENVGVAGQLLSDRQRSQG
ncbi:4-oxalocrotonate tautomerase [Clostridiales bacterium PH28_bin88]|nr:4-oxalocrotonate tautomerase [Clostridiales bacterium PH28_bin88]